MERTMPEPTRGTALLERVAEEAVERSRARRAAGDSLEIRSECETCGNSRIVPVRRVVTATDARREIDYTYRSCPDCVRTLSPTELAVRAGIRPEEVRTFSGWSDSEPLQAAKNACQELLNGARSVVFLRGSWGVGKSHLAKATLHAWLGRGGSGLYRNVPDLLDDMRATYQRVETQWRGDDFAEERARESFRLTDMLASLERTGLLVLDDFGAHKTTEWASEKLYQVVERRRRSSAPLLVTTNVRPSEEQEHERLLDRLGVGEVVITGAKSRRREFER